MTSYQHLLSSFNGKDDTFPVRSLQVVTVDSGNEHIKKYGRCNNQA